MRVFRNRSASAQVVCGMVGFVALVAGMATPAQAQDDDRQRWEFTLSLGYSQEKLSDTIGPFSDRGGFRVEPRFTFTPLESTPEFKLGIGIGMSGYSKSVENDGDNFVVIDGEVFFINVDDTEALSFITPELQLSWRQLLGNDRRWFVEPGVGVGVVIGNYWVGNTWGWWGDIDVDEWDATVGVRPFLRAGYQSRSWQVGIESSYMWGGDLDFTDTVGGNIEEFYVGAYFGGRW